MADHARIIELRVLLAEKFPATQTKSGAHFTTGIAALDERLGGGFPKAAITEIFDTSHSAGAGFVLTALLEKARRENTHLGLIDGSDGFDPQPLGHEILHHLLWVRCESAAQAIKAADLLLRDGNLPLIALDLRGNADVQLRKIPSTTWYRFQRIAEQGTFAFLVLTPRPMIPSADVRIKAQSRFALDALDRTLDELLSELQFEIVRQQAAAPERREEAM